VADLVFLTIAEVLAIHQLQIEEYGGVQEVCAIRVSWNLLYSGL
jgi:hypothetical protein